MCCFSFASFCILINGVASGFFHAERGLRQGCPLSPSSFFVNHGRSKHIDKNARSVGELGGVMILDMTSLSHLDDVLIFINGSFVDSSYFKEILSLFCKATGMEPNYDNSTIICVACLQNEERYASQHFDFVRQELDSGLKYLGFRLKPNGYRIIDWSWLIAKIESCINPWQQRWLSRDVRLTLIKSMFEAIPIYWMNFSWIPKGILNRIQQICCRFLWRGKNVGQTFAWVHWDRIGKPKKWGGWGIKDLHIFAKALAAKMGWKIIKFESLWKEVVILSISIPFQ